MHARTASDTYVELCGEDKTEPGDEHRCGKLMKSIYGSKAPVHDWQSEVTRTMKDFGIQAKQSISVCVFWLSAKRHESVGTRRRFRIIRPTVGTRVAVQKLAKQFETKTVRFGEDDDLAKESRVLNRIVRWHPCKGTTHEGDPRHVEIISREAGEGELKTISTLTAKRKRDARDWKRRDKICTSAG